MTPRTILLVDDDESVRLTCAAVLEDDGHRVLEAGTLAEARRRLADAAIDAVMIDLHLPDGLGTMLVAELRASHPAAAVVLLTGADAADDGAVDLVLVKGGDPAQLGARVEAAIVARAAAR